jgi:hypothetical protein
MAINIAGDSPAFFVVADFVVADNLMLRPGYGQYKINRDRALIV